MRTTSTLSKALWDAQRLQRGEMPRETPGAVKLVVLRDAADYRRAINSGVRRVK